MFKYEKSSPNLLRLGNCGYLLPHPLLLCGYPFFLRGVLLSDPSGVRLESRSDGRRFLILMITHALFAVITGNLIDRYGPRTLFPLGATFLAVGLAAASTIPGMFGIQPLPGCSMPL
jgi:MFS family permease